MKAKSSKKLKHKYLHGSFILSVITSFWWWYAIPLATILGIITACQLAWTATLKEYQREKDKMLIEKEKDLEDPYHYY